MAAATHPVEINVDPFSEEVLAYPYDFHEQLREAGPAARLTAYGIYAVGRYAEVKTVLSDYERFMARAGTGLYDLRKPGAWRPPSPLLETDPPFHTKTRATLTKIISPVVVRGWRANFEKMAAQVVEEILDKREFDAVPDIAEAFVITAFPSSLGVDIPRENAVAVGDMNFNAIGPQNDLYWRSLKVVEPILDWYQKSFQRESMQPGGFGEKIYQAEDAGDLVEGTAVGHVRSIIRGGMDTTVAGIGFTLNQLARHPEQWAMVHAEPSRMKSAFEEAIRYESPAQTQFRTVVEDTELDGCLLEKDNKVAIFMGSANRDPRQWDEPTRFDITRNTAGVHLAFGMGDHICIGQNIARLEADIILTALAKRIRAVELAGEPSYRLINTLRTLKTLPLRVTPA